MRDKYGSQYKRILSLDGGGSWAMIEARALGEIFGARTPGREILSHFDLVVANSGGTLVTGCLAMDMSPAQIVAAFMDQAVREQLFHSHRLPHVSRYSTADKLQGIRAILNRQAAAAGQALDADAPLSRFGRDAQLPKLLFVAFDFMRQRAVLFRSDVHSAASNGAALDDAQADAASPTLAEALHASSTAPVRYFDHPAEFATPAFQGRKFWDGAIAGYNNPVMAGLTEALANGVSAEQISILSIGTATVALPMGSGAVAQDAQLLIDPSQAARDYLWSEVPVLATSILADPPDVASFSACCMLHGRVTGIDPRQELRLIRLNPLIQPVPDAHGVWQVPDGLGDHPGDVAGGLRNFAALVKLDMDAVKADEVALIDRLCSAWIAGQVRNQPIQAGDQASGLSCRLGYRTFTEGRDRARDLFA